MNKPRPPKQSTLELVVPIIMGLVIQVAGIALALSEKPGTKIVHDLTSYSSSTTTEATGSRLVSDAGFVIAGLGSTLALVYLIALGVALGMRFHAEES